MKRQICIFLLLLAVLLCCACAQTKQEETVGDAAAEAAPAEVTSAAEAVPAEPAAEAPAPAEAPAEPEASPEPAKEELPPPPDIDIDSWEFLYAGPYAGLSDYYQPDPIAWTQGVYMDKRVLEPMREFLQGAKDAGYKVYVAAGYFVTEYQDFWYERYIRDYGSAYEATKHVFAPGCSDHCTGLAFDITDEQEYAANYYEQTDPTVADTEVCKWMEEHCAEYGFIVRYPEGKEQYYTLACHPGHFRYVGKEAAAYIMENGLCLEEFIDLYKENTNYPKGDYPKAS